MSKYFQAALILILVFSISFSVSGQSLWSDAVAPERSNQVILPASFRSVHLNEVAFANLIADVPHENQVAASESNSLLQIPMPDGAFRTFSIVEAPVMAPELGARYSFIKSFAGVDISESQTTIRFSVSHKGFHAIIFTPEETIYIDPFAQGTTDTYMSYTKADFYQTCSKEFTELAPIPNPEFEISPEQADKSVGKKRPVTAPVDEREVLVMGMRTTSGNQLRTYDLALACTGEYATYHGGTTADALAAMNVSMTRVNGIYEKDVAIRMVMVANNDQIIFLNGGSDPYSNGNGGAMLGQNQTTCDNIIGFNNYDIGHVFSTGGGGVANLQSPCSSNKAGGVTGGANPVNDPFDIDYVCHEMGHQFGGNHTQNNNCNRSSGAAFEPGSASTIMGYAGICTPNLQSNSDDHFHNHSYNEIISFSILGNGNTCATVTNTGNTPPTINAGTGGFTIPISTPFELTGIGADSDGDALTYNWEEYDLGPATAAGDNNLTNPSGNQPIFRSWPSSTSPTRVFPRIPDLVNNTTTIGEFLPNYSRSLQFKCTVRDNRVNGGGVSDDLIQFDVDNGAGPFLVLSPNTPVLYLGNTTQTITWDVANTNVAPVSAPNVDIYLSVDGGYTFPTILVANTANDGSQNVFIPAGETTLARIKVKASNNIFFDISNQNFTIGPAGGSNDYDIGLSGINSPTGDYCGDTYSPEIVVSNFGAVTITSFDVVYDLDSGTSSNYTWSGSIATGETTSITLPSGFAPTGAHSFNISVENPNGQLDENNTNDSGSSSFSTVTGGSDVTFSLLTDCWGEEVGWTLQTDGGTVIDTQVANTLADQTQYTWNYCLAADCYDLIITDSFGDGLEGTNSGCAIDGDYSVEDSFGNVLVQMAIPNYGSSITESFCVPVTLPGCTNPSACNFNPAATSDNGSCILPDGCADPGACNFDNTATCDDGSCEFISCAGCTDAGACNYNGTATIDDGSCEYISCAGCMDNLACNYDATATIDDGSCEYLTCAGCTDITACNYDPTASIEDGSCITPTTYYADSDSDGFGDINVTQSACSAPVGYVLDNTDCDDTRGDVYPGAPGTGEGVDNNCNGSIDPSETAVCVGDFNGDNQINVQDLLILLGEFGCTNACITDMNNDGLVTSSDMLTFLSLYGTSCN
jgi:hypothetical protein